MKTKLLFYLMLLFSITTFAQTTAIPDPNFEQALINLGYDTGPTNGSVPTANISGIINLNIASNNITNLTGIQDFTSLINLDCYSNQLTSLNLSGMTNLKSFNCSANQLTSLNASGLNSLIRIICNFNSITSLNAANLTNLNEIQCQGNQLSSLSITGSNQLATLMLASNQLTTINVAGLTNLHTLHCGSNLLTNLNVSGLNNLLDLRFEFNQIPSINLNGLVNLTTLDCRGNLLPCIDLTNKPALIDLACFQSPTLTCIQVDNIALAQSNLGWNKDATAAYSLNCAPCTGAACLTLYADTDNDGYDNGSIIDCSGTVPTGYSLTSLGPDCDDTNASITSSLALPTNIQSGLLAFYAFNAGSISDFSGNAHDLTSSFSGRPVNDRNGNGDCAIEFNNLPNSNNEFLSTTNTTFLNGLTAYSVSCWYKPLDVSRNAGDYEALVNRDLSTGPNPVDCPDRIGQWSLGLYDCRRAVFGRENSVWDNEPCDVIANTGTWHHLTATYNQVGNTIKLYKDGVLQNTASGVLNCGIGGTLPALDIGDLFLGKNYTGVLDDVLIHNREITASEVTQLYGLGSSCCSAANPCATLVTPIFTPIAPICLGAAIPTLPTISTNGITGTWSPAISNTVSTIVTFTPNAGQCATTTTLEVVVISGTNSQFINVSTGIDNSGNALAVGTVDPNWQIASSPNPPGTPVLVSDYFSPYWEVTPVSSTNAGWINHYGNHLFQVSQIGIYTFERPFTVGVGTTTIDYNLTVAYDDVLVNFEFVRPDGTVSPINVTVGSSGARFLSIPTPNSVFPSTQAGVWKIRAVVNFIDQAAGFLLSGTITVNTDSSTIPTFTPIAPICIGTTLSPLPTTSNNGIIGTWSPALSNTVTTTYTFTPNAGQCATTTTMTIVVNPNVTTTFAAIAPICSSITVSPLPTISNNSIGITGTWSPMFNNTATTTYTFTPNAGQCATIASTIIAVTTASTWYLDNDNDTYGNASASILACSRPTGYVTNNTDCNDSNADVNPNHVEVPGNGIDDNCSGTIDEITPPVKVIPSQCGTTLSTLWDTIFSTQYSGTPAPTSYRFEISNGTFVRTFDTSLLPQLNKCTMYDFPCVTFNTTYSVRVAVKVNGFWQAYGPPCNITTPLGITTSLIPSSCGTTLSSSWDTIFISPIGNRPCFTVTAYRVKVVDGNGRTSFLTLPPTMPRFNLRDAFVPAVIRVPNATYLVSIQIQLNNVWQLTPSLVDLYGTICVIRTSPTFSRQAESTADATDFNAKAYPNPYADDFNLDIHTASDENLEVKIYDMMGRLIASHQVTIADLSTITFGEHYASGVYNVIVTQGENVKTLRVIKR